MVYQINYIIIAGLTIKLLWTLAIINSDDDKEEDNDDAISGCRKQ